MFPFIVAGSELQVEPVTIAALCVGDVVCFIGEQQEMVAHRLSEVVQGGAELLVRGDRDGVSERVPAVALLGRVTSVRKGRFSYRTGSRMGQVMARTALEHRALHHALVVAAKFAVGLRKRFR